ncbi:unnamed protein product [Clavelina lepadiformis]|uniref:EGF-like domain-containing protein n=1 Tax=Clavelina lepadiformis TaxID=159417 RepID=A0ABP0GM56_CLALP
MTMKVSEYLWRVAFVTTILALVGTSVGNPNEGDCALRCNLGKGYCQPDGTCSCYPGWEGDNCEQCTLAPGCIHGTCDQPWQCNCKAGYGGRHCHLDMQFCERHNPCYNGATCINKQGSYVCVCPEGYTGRNCNEKRKPVVIVPPTVAHSTQPNVALQCLNGGTCSIGNGIAGCGKCSCPSGYAGDRCETRIKMCLTRPCANGGRCHDLIGDFSCECARGYVGRYCNQDVNECAIMEENACANGGRCINRKGSYRCVCVEGYQGARCEKAVKRLPVPTVSTTTTTTLSVAPVQLGNAVKSKKSSLQTLFSGTGGAKFPKIQRISPPKKSHPASTNIKVTHIIHKLEVESSNSDVSYVENVVDGSALLNSSSDQASVSVVQAVTFAFLGVAVALFIGIAAFMWIYCGKRGRVGAAFCYRGSHQAADDNDAENKRTSRNSIVIPPKTGDAANEKRDIACNPPLYRSKPELVVRTVTPPRGSRNASTKPHPVDCLYVALPQGSNSEIATIDEINSLLDINRLTHSSDHAHPL